MAAKEGTQLTALNGLKSAAAILKLLLYKANHCISLLLRGHAKTIGALAGKATLRKDGRRLGPPREPVRPARRRR